MATGTILNTDKIESITVTGVPQGSSVEAEKIGRVVHIVATANNVPSGSWFSLGTIPDKPPSYATALVPNGAVSGYALLRCKTDGAIELFHSLGSIQSFYNGNLTFFVH